MTVTKECYNTISALFCDILFEKCLLESIPAGEQVSEALLAEGSDYGS